MHKAPLLLMRWRSRPERAWGHGSRI